MENIVRTVALITRFVCIYNLGQRTIYNVGNKS